MVPSSTSSIASLAHHPALKLILPQHQNALDNQPVDGVQPTERELYHEKPDLSHAISLPPQRLLWLSFNNRT
jgi:hypothetical protein